ncbi:hypothetical protein IM697_18725 [Streptomyces ferrugineus]|uniref:Uncharacterized protein n=1 Tax=Streptomyces ferrugineus TaxID=1413221 RepID=A0A7M2SX88_9ACTN|nr:DUF6332 family protein [Streptomyces ferrugineus]QOV40255.1 hypothetical protein IM697_18725 [Streptomyces ferrugineus]
MENHGGRRDQAERDAITVEIGYALFSAAFAAAVLFGAIVGPAYAFDMSDGTRGALVGVGATVAVVVFFARVVSVLMRFRRGPQPSQPGRTNPDS